MTNKYAAVVTAETSADGHRDVNEVQSGGFDRVPARAGVALLRFKSYIETGNHTVKKGQGKGKKQDWADLTFELVHPDHMIGPDDAKFPDTISLNNLNISMNEKAKYYKIFHAMNFAEDKSITSFSQMLGRPFLAEIYHNKVEKTTYCNLDKDGAYSIRAPRYAADPIGAPDVITEIAVPEMFGDAGLFLFDANGVDAGMVQMMWDDLFIDGEKSDGTKKKNWMQDKIRSANNFDGSFVQSVVGGTAIVEAEVADTIADAVANNTPDASAGHIPAGTVVDDTPFTPDTPNVAVQTAAVVDPLASIPGL